MPPTSRNGGLIDPLGEIERVRQACYDAGISCDAVMRLARSAVSENRAREAPDGMRWMLVDDTPPLEASDMYDHGALFGLRFVDGCSNGCAEIYVEDDGNWHFKMRFDRVWLDDLFSLLLSEREHRK